MSGFDIASRRRPSLDNRRRITLPAGEKTPVHEHPAGVAVFLNASRNRVSPVGGKADDTPRKEGQVFSGSAVKHVVENLGTTTAEIVLVELKKPASH